MWEVNKGGWRWQTRGYGYEKMVKVETIHTFSLTIIKRIKLEDDRKETTLGINLETDHNPFQIVNYYKQSPRQT